MKHVRARLNLNLSYIKHLVEIKSAVLRAIQPCQTGFEAAGRARLNGKRASAVIATPHNRLYLPCHGVESEWRRTDSLSGHGAIDILSFGRVVSN